MSKAARRLRISDIAISEQALLLLHMADNRLPLRMARHVQVAWAKMPRQPGHALVLDLEVGDVLCSAFLGGRGKVHAVIVTRTEAVIMQARALDPNAPGTVSELQRLTVG